MTLRRIREWYEAHDGKVSVSFSGGKDSTVLLNLVRSIYPDVPAIFIDTGLEWPEVRAFVKTVDNVVWRKPKYTFKQIVEKYGYPVVSKEVSQFIYEARTTNSNKLRTRRMSEIPKKWLYLLDAPFKISHVCCHYLKKKPLHDYEKETGNKPFVGTMAENSRLRLSTYLQHGCNAFDQKYPQSKPLSFWTEQDVFDYIKNIPYSKIYDIGYTRTGCMFCMFGCHMEKTTTKFQQMAKSHPRLHRKGLPAFGIDYILTYLGVPY